MKKFLKEALHVEQAVADGQSLMRISVPTQHLKDWCLCLQLLKENLIEAFVHPCESSSQRIEITRGGTERCEIVIQHDRVSAQLCDRDLDFVCHFFLRYYRDGIAEVDHIDIETADGGYLTLATEESIDPISSEEAKRRLGM
jgi:hypothetical protein